MKYYILAVRMPIKQTRFERYEMVFGDYDKACVTFEKQDHIEKGYSQSRLKIVTLPDDKQETIDKAIHELNSVRSRASLI